MYRKFAALICFVTICSAGFNSYGGDFEPQVELNLMPGTDRVLGRLDLRVPLAQTKRSLWFIDARGVIDDNHSLEGNLGLAYRKLTESGNWIVGGYGFYDLRRSPFHNRFHQLTLGAELLGKLWDFRANVYLPELGKKHVRTTSVTTGSGGGTSTSYQLQGNNILATTTGGSLTTTTKSYERALRGFDIEIGRKLPWFDNVRGYLAGYLFDAHHAPGASGFRSRIESKVNDFFSVGAMYQYDDLREGQAFLELRFILSPSILRGTKPKHEGLLARMTERIVRDVDVVSTDKGDTQVTSTGSGSGGTTTTFVLDGAGNPQEIWYVKNDVASNGDGTVETPFDNLADAQSSLGTYDWVFVYEGDGTTTNLNTGLTLPANAKLLGEGVGLSAVGQNFIAAGSNPVLTATAGAAAVLGASDNEIAGVTVDSTTGVVSGITVIGANQHIHDVTVSSPGFHGIAASEVTGTLTIGDSTISGAVIGSAITVARSSATAALNAIIRDNTISSSNQIDITYSNATAAADTLTISGNTLTTATSKTGIAVGNTGAGSVTTTVSNNSVTGGAVGIILDSRGTSNGTITGTLSSNTFANQTQNGIVLITQGASTNANLIASLSSNTVSGSTASSAAIAVESREASNLDVVIQNHSTLEAAVGDFGLSYTTAGTSTGCVELINSSTNRTWDVNNTGGTLNFFFDSGNNSPGSFSSSGTITSVAQGTCSTP